MKLIVVGATGTIGKAVAALLAERHEVVAVSHRAGDHRVDLADPKSIAEMYRAIGRVDGVVSAAGEARFAPLEKLSDEDFRLSLGNKLMGQVNLVRLGLASTADGGSFTLTSGILSRTPMQGASAVSLVNAGIEGFVRSASLELPRGIRLNAVAPGWVAETLRAMGRDPAPGTPAAVVARSYLESVEGRWTGHVIDAVGT